VKAKVGDTANEVMDTVTSDDDTLIASPQR